MQDEIEDRVRHRAFDLWEREGRPDGRHLDHWSRARTEIEAEAGKGKSPARQKSKSSRAAAGTAARR